MRENFDPRQLVDRDTLKRLMARSDGPAARRLAIHLGLYVATLVGLGVAGTTLSGLARAPIIVALGFLIFTLYAPFHEATHGTAFATKRWNTAAAWLTGVLYGYSPGVHTDFHFTHHRLTNLEGDPEKGLSLPADLPARTPILLLLLGFLGSLPPLHSLVLALAPASLWDRLEAGWTRPDKRARLKRESAVVAAIWVAAVAAAATLHPTLLVDYGIAIFLGRTMHGLTTISEHEGMLETGHQIERTRTVTSNRVFQWFWWNMNLHAEHHGWPAVPFHQLPALHRLVAERGVHTERSYSDFYRRRGYREGPSARLRSDGSEPAIPA